MGGFWTAFVTVLTAIVTLGVIAVLVAPQAKTSGVLNSFWTGFSGSIAAANNPFSGAASGYSSITSGILGGLGTASL
jgi:hypothetical protein